MGSQDLHLYPGQFRSSPSSPLPHSFSVMRRPRRRGSSYSSRSSYLPVVVLSGQQEGAAQAREQRAPPQHHALTHDASERWPGAFTLPDLSFGLFGSRSEPLVSERSDLLGSHSFGGCGGGGGGGGLSSSDLILFLAALAASVFFLNQAITMNIGRKRRMTEHSGLLPLLAAGQSQLQTQPEQYPALLSCKGPIQIGTGPCLHLHRLQYDAILRKAALV